MSRPFGRRSFLKAAAVGSALASSPWLLRGSTAQEATYGGPYWLFVNAAGGWDPRFMFDPTLNPEQNRLYTEIRSVGNIPYAPIPIDLDQLGYDTTLGYESTLITAEGFLTKWGSRLTVINGIDTQTNSHDGGRRAMGSGRLTVGYPSLGALIASARAAKMPMAYFSGGGFDATENLVPLTRVSNVDALQRIAAPNELTPGDAETERFHTPETMARIMRAQRDRNQELRDAQRLPKLKRSAQDLLDARASVSLLDRLDIPEPLVEIEGNDLNDLERFMRQAQMSLGAFAGGLSAVSSVALGRFDPHANHDRVQTGQVLKLLAGVDFIMEEAQRLGLQDRLFVVATSDFGRGPHYNGTNDGSGKDHWPIGSMFAMGPGIVGDRVIGATDDAQLPRPIDPETLEVAGNGVTLAPEMIHAALRRLAQVADHSNAEAYPLAGDALPLFG